MPDLLNAKWEIWHTVIDSLSRTRLYHGKATDQRAVSFKVQDGWIEVGGGEALNGKLERAAGLASRRFAVRHAARTSEVV